MTESRPLPARLRKAVRCPRAPYLLFPILPKKEKNEGKEKKKKGREKRKRKKGGEITPKKRQKKGYILTGARASSSLSSHTGLASTHSPPSTARGAVLPALVSRRMSALQE